MGLSRYISGIFSTFLSRLRWGGDLVPDVDDAQSIGSPAIGIEELHIAPDTLIRETLGTLTLHNSAMTDRKVFSIGQQLDLDGEVALRHVDDYIYIGEIGHAPRLINLTTVQKIALDEVAGMVIYDTDLAKFQDYLAAWNTRSYIDLAETITGDKIFDSSIQHLHNVLLGVETDISGVSPIVANNNSFTVTNPGATTVTDFTLGLEGQVIYLRFTNANTTLAEGARIYLYSGANKTFAAGDMCVLILRGIVWHQIGGVT